MAGSAEAAGDGAASPRDLPSLVGSLLRLQPWWLGATFGLWSLVLLALPLDPDYTSGELLDHLTAWREGESLYRPLSEGAPWRVLNYPPLFLAVVRGGAALTGLPLLPMGRLLNGLAAVLLVAGVWRWMRDDGRGSWRAVWICGLLAASYPFLYGAGQLHLEPAAVASVVWGGVWLRRDGAGPWIGGVLLAIGCFVKHTQVIPSLALLAWALWCSRARGLRALVAWAGTGVLGSAVLSAAWGGEVWRHLLSYTVGSFALGQLGLQLLSHALPWAGFAGVAVALALRRPELRRSAAWWYFVGAGVWTLSSARVGAAHGYFLDWHVATVLVLGSPIAEAVTPYRRGSAAGVDRGSGWMTGPLGLALLLQMTLADLGVAGVLATDLQRTSRLADTLPGLCRRLPGPGRPVPVASPGAARACGARPVLHPFAMSSLTRRGLWNPEPFAEAVREGRYPVAALDFDPTGQIGRVQRERWAEPLLNPLRESYRVVEHGGFWWILEPR